MSRTLRLIAAIAIVALIGAVGAGCGSKGSSETTGTAGGGGKQAVDRGRAVKFSECMRENGVGDFPDPNADGDFEYGVSVTPAVFRTAVDACKELQPPGSLSADRTPAQQKQALAFARCVRENGVTDFPDPIDGEPLIDTYRIPSSQAQGGMTILNAAVQTCRDLMAKALAGQK